jgi:hypothetical protein
MVRKQAEVLDTQTFDPQKHLIQLKGKLYLETKFRIQWFRQEHPRGCISTEIVSLDPVLVKATIYSAEGTVLGTAHAGAVDKGTAVWSGRSVEKSETAAIGRALAHAGYGTQFATTEDSSPLDTSLNRYTPMPQVTPNTSRRSTSSGNGSGGSEDLRDKDVASRFIQRWRGQSLSDTDVLTALGVAKLSEWTKGRAAADEAVNAWLAAKLTQESA